jgi:hypothetical protein
VRLKLNVKVQVQGLAGGWPFFVAATFVQEFFPQQILPSLSARPVAEYGNGKGENNSRNKNRVDNIKPVQGGTSAEYRLSYTGCWSNTGRVRDTAATGSQSTLTT